MYTIDRRASRRATRSLAALAAVASLAFAACSDDDETSAAEDTGTVASTAVPTTPAPTTTPTTATPAETDPAPTTEGREPAGSTPATFAPEFAEYCALVVETADAFPTPEQLAQFRELAPAEISEQVNFVVDAFLAAGDDPFSAIADPAVEEALAPIEEFEARECGVGGEEEEGPPQDPSVTQIDPEATRVDLSGTDFAFHGDFPTTAGRYSFVMTNDGEAPHIMILLKLAEGATLDEVMASEGEEGVEASFESDLAPPGVEAVLTADLTTGNWIMLCPIPGPEGKPHVELGMIHEFTIS